MDLFIEKGYDKASLRELAERMGFTKAALYYHFQSKQDILFALHERLHSLIDGPIELLGEGPVTVDAWERFLGACVDQLEANLKLFEVHRVNQAALSKIHIEGHEGAHFELEERARKIFSDPLLSLAQRARMAAAFGAAFVTPVLAGNLFGPDPASHEGPTDVGAILRQILADILRPARPGPRARRHSPQTKRRLSGTN